MVGTDTWYSARYRQGYSRDTHDVCARLAAFDQQLAQDIKSTPSLDPTKTQLLVTFVAQMRSQSCSQ